MSYRPQAVGPIPEVHTWRPCLGGSGDRRAAEPSGGDATNVERDPPIPDLEAMPSPRLAWRQRPASTELNVMAVVGEEDIVRMNADEIAKTLLERLKARQEQSR